MAIKFLQEKKKQEIMIYLAGFIIILSALIYFIGVDFDFEEPDVVLEGRENFLEIRTTLESIESDYDFARFRSFNLIQPFGETPGRQNPFQAEGMETIEVIEEEVVEVTEPVAEEEPFEDIFDSPEEETVIE